MAERSYPTRSDLIEMGYDKGKVAAINAGGDKQRFNTRYQGGEGERYQGQEPSQDVIETHECYIRLDADGDGVGELLKVVIANDTILEWGEADYIPYASGTPFLQPHRFDGLGLFDKLKSVQDQKTHTIRQWADNQNNANNSRSLAVTNAVNMDDLVNSRPGGVVRTTMPNAVTPFPFNDVSGSCAATLDYLDKVRSERGGASLDMLAAEAQIAGDTAHGVERMMSAKEQMAALMTRTLAETLVKTVYEMVHHALRLYVSEPLVFRIAGQFTKANPAEWAPRERVSVRAGLSTGERQQKRTALEQVLARQSQLIEMGMDDVLVSLENVYNAQADWARCYGVTGVESYFVDPGSEEGQALQQQKLQREAEQAEAQAQMQEQLLELQRLIEDRKADNADAKVIEDGRQHDGEMQFKYDELEQEAALAEGQAIIDTTMKLVGSNTNEPDTAGGGAS